MSQPFIDFESLENGIVARYMKCVERERPVTVNGLPSGLVDDMITSLVPQVVAVLRRAGMFAPDSRDEFEKKEDEIAEQEIEAERPPPRMEKYFVLEPVSKFVADGDYQELIATVAIARMEFEKAARENAQPVYSAVAYRGQLAR